METYPDVYTTDTKLLEYINLYRNWDSKSLLYPNKFGDFCEVIDTYPEMSSKLKRYYGLNSIEKVISFQERCLEFFNKHEWENFISDSNELYINVTKVPHTQKTFTVEYPDTLSRNAFSENKLPITAYAYINGKGVDYLTISDIKVDSKYEYKHLIVTYKFNRNLVQLSCQQPTGDDYYSAYNRLNTLYFSYLQKEPDGGLIWKDNKDS